MKNNKGRMIYSSEEEKKFKRIMEQIKIGVKIQLYGKMRLITSIVPCSCDYGRYCVGKIGLDGKYPMCRVSGFSPFFGVVIPNDFIIEEEFKI